MLRKPRRRGTLRDPYAVELAARERREQPTRAERELAAILSGLSEGALQGRFRRECVCGEWILDFYFPEVRLGIEVDGGYHRSTRQQGRDLVKRSGLAGAGVTLLRLTNEEVFGDRARLVGKLREAWRSAARRARGGPPRLSEAGDCGILPYPLVRS